MWRKERFKDMEELFKEFEFNESTTCDITEINGMQLPRDYLEFMHEHNGGEGDVGKNSYMQFIKFLSGFLIVLLLEEI